MQATFDYRLRAEDITDNLIMTKCRSLNDAVRLCRDCSPLSDEEMIDCLEKKGVKIQRPHFVDCMAGRRNFPLNGIQMLEDCCGNWIPTRYLVLSRNHEMRPKREAWEIENEQLREALAEKEREIEIIKKWEAGKR